MYLIGEYEWRGQLRRDGYRPTREEIAIDADRWLLELFSGEKYDYESIGIFKFHPELVDNFIRYEIFADDGIIKINFSRRMTLAEQMSYKFIAAAFLFHQHYSRQEIYLPRGENLQKHIKNFFRAMFRECREHLPYTRLPFGGEYYSCYELDQLTETVLETLEKTSFVFTNPNNPSEQFVHNQSNEFVQLELRVVPYEEDFALNITYSEYLQYLLTFERNGIMEFKSSLNFWQNHVGLGRQHVNLEDCAEPDKVLLIFSLALGMDNLVYDRLHYLRGRNFPNQIVRRALPQIGKAEENFLYELLKDAPALCDEARRQVEAVKIPRHILLNANEKLLGAKLNPIFAH